MNKVMEIGRLTRDVELRYTQSGKAFATFCIAVDDGFGQDKKSYFFNVVVWGKPAETCANNLKKGSKIAVTGKLTSRQYENKAGQKVTAVEIVAEMYGGVDFLDGKKQSQEQTHDESQQGQPSQQNWTEEIPF